MKIDLKDKVALVTGSRRGIGKKIAEALASCGATVIVTATSQEGCEEVAKELKEKFGVETFALKADIKNKDEINELINKSLEKFGKIDILVNNAGITKDNLLMRMSDDEWQTVIDTNLNSVFHFIKGVVRPMMKNKFGRIINISSVVGLMGNPGQVNYAATKAGVLGITKSVAKEFGKKGITCNAIAPGFIKTDMTESLPQEMLDNLINMLPLQRMGEPEEIASMVAFLASDYANYITGQVIKIDGGMLME